MYINLFIYIIIPSTTIKMYILNEHLIDNYIVVTNITKSIFLR
jgi:hypothetical protein